MGCVRSGLPWGRAGLTLVAVREEVGARAQVVAVEAVDGHGGVLPHATPEPAHGGERRAASATLACLLAPSRPRPRLPGPQPIERRLLLLLPAYQDARGERRERLLKETMAGGCLATVVGGDRWR